MEGEEILGKTGEDKVGWVGERSVEDRVEGDKVDWVGEHIVEEDRLVEGKVGWHMLVEDRIAHLQGEGKVGWSMFVWEDKLVEDKPHLQVVNKVVDCSCLGLNLCLNPSSFLFVSLLSDILRKIQIIIFLSRLQ